MKISPSKVDYPESLNLAALKVWQYIIHRYSDLIFSSGSVDTQWFRAKRLFEQACKSRDVEPYTGNTNKLHEISSKLRLLC